MRALKTILIILASLITLWLVLCAVGPRTLRTQQRTHINAPVHTVYEHIRHLRNMDEWGVWARSDPKATFTYNGEDGTVGFQVSWNGPALGKGSNTIMALDPDKQVRTELAFGGVMRSEIAMDVLPTDSGTQVTMAIAGETPFLMRAMTLFMGTGRIDKDFADGLANLKIICEALPREAEKAPEALAIEIVVSDRPAMLYFGERKRVKWSALKDFFGASFGKTMELMTEAGVQPAGAPSGVYFEWDELNQEADLLAGFPVPAEAKARLKGMTLYSTPASRAYALDHFGGYGDLEKAHLALDARMRADSVDLNMNVVEEYITDPGTEPDSSKWLTRIIHLVK